MDMSTILKEFENKAKNLPLKERAALIGSLIYSLDELDETECEHSGPKRRINGIKPTKLEK